MIIENLNSIKLGRIIKQEDINLVISGESYYNEVKQRVDRLYEDAKKELEKLKVDTYNDIVDKLTSQNEQALVEFKCQLDEFLNCTVENIYSIIYKVLTKFGYNNLGAENIRLVIKEELHDANIHQVLRIVANNTCISLLKNDPQIEKLVSSIIWEEDNSLNDDECICSTSLWTLRIGFKKALGLILEQLRNEGDD